MRRNFKEVSSTANPMAFKVSVLIPNAGQACERANRMTAAGSFDYVFTSFKGVPLLALSHQLWLQSPGISGPLPRFGSFICWTRRLRSWSDAASSL
jgi:hypothetical protein